MYEVDGLTLVIAFLAALAAGAINSIAGGGTLLTFPILIALGLNEKTANITSTLGLWPGSLGGAWGYRHDIAQDARQFWPFFLPSLLGGGVGASLLLATSPEAFQALVPWLILTATCLFMLQGYRARHQGKTTDKAQVTVISHDGSSKPARRWLTVFLVQFLVAVYGGYFGAGIGILMLATLGFLGLRDIHLMNGLKNVGGLCINGMAIALFLVRGLTTTPGLIHWPVVAVMAIGAILGGYYCAGFAKRIGPVKVRLVVVCIGLGGVAWTGWRFWSGA